MASQKCFMKIASLSFVVLAIAILAICCHKEKNTTFENLKEFINTIKVVDSHEHQRRLPEYEGHKHNFYTLLANHYLNSDLVSAGAPPISYDSVKEGNLEEYWENYGRYLEFSRNTSYYRHYLSGFRLLYGYDAPYFTKEGIGLLSEKISENYSNFDEWYARAFETAGFEIMLVDPFWNPFDIDLDRRYFAVVFDIDPLVWAISERKRLTMEEHPVFRKQWENIYSQHNVYERAQKEGFPIKKLDDYLAYADVLFQKLIDKKAVGIKNFFACVRNLDYAYVPYEKAKALFEKSSSSLSDEEKKALQDFMFHWIIKKSIKFSLPIQIHTGYLGTAGGNTLENSRPLDLNNLFLRYPEATFVLLHGGYPWIGEWIALAKMFPNVYLDIVWLPQISREAAVRALDEMLDCVPYNKFFWGGDCTTIEGSVGALEFGKEVVVQVLAARVKRGFMTEEVARDVALKLFRENAIRIFNLKEMYNIDF